MLGLVVPVLLFAVLSVIPSARRRIAIKPQVALIAAATLIVIFAAVMIERLGRVASEEQIAWTGIEWYGAHGGAMELGGPRAAAVIGWPSGTFEPRVRLRRFGTTVTVESDGGTAFLIDAKGRRFLNGQRLSTGDRVALGGYRIEVSKAFPWFLRDRLRVFNARNECVTDTAVWLFTTKVLALPDEGGNVKDPRYHEWAPTVLIGVADHELYLVSYDIQSSQSCDLPCVVQMHRRRSHLTFTIAARPTQGLAVEFMAPFRHVSPIPPTESGTLPPLVVTAEPEPDDRAFLLPFGGGIERIRQIVNLAKERDGSIQFTAISPNAPARDPELVSSVSVVAQPYAFAFSIVRGGFAPRRVIALLVLALIVLALSTLVFYRKSESHEGSVTCGVALGAFALLGMRVLLAARYGISMAHLDRIEVQGLAFSMAGLTAIPALMLTAAAVRRDVLRRSGTPGSALLAGATIAVAVWIDFMTAAHIWPATPPALIPRFCTLSGATAVGLLVLGLISLGILSSYRHSRWRALLRFADYHEGATAIAQEFWNSLAARTGRTTLRTVVSIAVFGFVLFAVLPLLASIAPGRRLAQEVVFPLFFVWAAALLWLTGIRAAQATARVRVRVVVWSAVLFLGPWIAFPIFIRDPGNLYATTAVFLPLSLILIPFRTTRFAGLVVMAMFVAVVGVVTTFALNVDAVYSLNSLRLRDVSGAASTRILVFKRGLALRGEASQQTASLRNAVQHVWENQAIARRGGIQGAGFGQAPVRRSRIPQEVLRFDSVYSFYVSGDFGAIGGLAVLALYVLALIIVIVTVIRSGLTQGLAFMLLLVTALAVEAIAHAGMNIGTLPFAGRNLPLLAATSGSDLFKWGALLIVAATAAEDRTPIAFDRRRVWTVALAGALPAVLFFFVAKQAFAVARNSQLDASFTWAPALRSVQNDIDQGRLVLRNRGGDHRIEPKEDYGVDRSWLQQEIDYFNALLPDEKSGAPLARAMVASAAGVRNLRTFDAWLERSSVLRPPAGLRHESIFQLVESDPVLDEAGEIADPNTPPFLLRMNYRTDAPYSFATEGRTPDEMPRVVIVAAAATRDFLLQGNSFTLRIPARNPVPYENRNVLLAPDGADDVEIRRDLDPTAPRGTVALQLRNVHNRVIEKPTFSFEMQDGQLRILNPSGGFKRFVRMRAGTAHRIAPDGVADLQPGDMLTIVTPIPITISVSAIRISPLIGPAWVMGQWRTAASRNGMLPWTHQLALALETEWARDPADAAARFGRLALNPALHENAQWNAMRLGRLLHNAKLQSGAGARRFTAILPPRVALSVMSIPDGRVLAQGGWPRQAGDRWGERVEGGEFRPGFEWTDELAPQPLRARYGNDRNFDLLLMGSSTKPVLAAAALAVHPGLDKQLQVRADPNERGIENHIFGVDIAAPNKGWQVHNYGTVDFARYLAVSDNRYQVRLGFIALAAHPGGAVAAGPVSPSTEESLTPGTFTPWNHFPAFPRGIGLSIAAPRQLRYLEQTPFASNLRGMFGINVRPGDYAANRVSFWTNRPGDDAVQFDDLPVSTGLRAISPRIANLRFDAIKSSRDFVSELLGGLNNRWSNIDFGGAFATAVTGHPVYPHITDTPAPSVAPNRITFPAVAARLRPGLSAVVLRPEGTAKVLVSGGDNPCAGSCGAGVYGELQRRVPNVRVYAKTGTLAANGRKTETTARLVLALVVWDDEAAGRARKGMVISIAAEDACIGAGACVLNRYLGENLDAIVRLLTN